MKRNVLLIVIDQLRADVLNGALVSCVPTPHLDALMDESCVFLNHHSATAPCGPSRVSLLTGLHALNHRAVHNGTPLSERIGNLGLELRKGGREPLVFGYTDTQPDPTALTEHDPARRSYTQVMRGFTEVVEFRDEAWVWLAHLRQRGYDVPDAQAPDHARLYRPQEGVLGAPALYRAEDSDTALLTDLALAQLDVRAQRPWFALLSYIRPHPPLVAPAPYHALIDPESLPVPVARNLAHPFFDSYFSAPSGADLFWGFDGDHDRLDASTIARLRATYLGLVAEVDHHLGRVLAWLDSSGQRDKTLLIVTSDHGEALGDHGLWGKRLPLAEAFHVPLIVRDPTHATPRRIEDPTSSVDIMPTILDWLDQPPPIWCDGQSLCPYLEQGMHTKPRQGVLSELDYADTWIATDLKLPTRHCRLSSWQTQRWRYVHFAGGLPPLLFDLEADPTQTKNLADSTQHQSVVQAQSAALLSQLMATATTWFADES